MHKVHVSTNYNHDLEKVFAVISDHRKFLSMGGMTCHIVQAGEAHKNGLGAIRKVRTKKYTFTEKITAYEHNKSYDYLITEVSPDLNFTHHNGWVELTETEQGVRADWHSHFTFNTPVIGFFIGLIAKKQIEKQFSKILENAKKHL